MKWFEGSIAEAVTTSKQKNAVFVVFIEGKDEASRVMHSAIDKSEVSNHLESGSFVSVMLESGSESHNQFSEIYKLVPVPSVFFIGQNGAPLEIVPGDNSEDTVVGKLKMAINKCIGTTPATPKAPPDDCDKEGPSTSQEVSSPATSEPPKPTSSQVVPEKLVLQPPAATQPEIPPKEKITDKDKITELLEKKKEERKIQEEKEEKERELERRQTGRTLTEAKRLQQERELQELKNERMKEKQEEKLAKQRVLDQIAQDRAERAARLANTQPSSSANPEPVPAEDPQPTSPSTASETARLQFKMPDGQTRMHSFPAETTLGQVRQFIDNNIVLPFREYQMATTFPRREFTVRDIDTTLRDLQLLPSAVILIMPLQGNYALSRGPGWSRMFMDMVWDILQPLFTFSNYLHSLVWGRGSGSSSSGTSTSRPDPPPSTQYTTSQPPPSRTVVRKRGNIHSLADNDNSNDENNTWNGNSTQQM